MTADAAIAHAFLDTHPARAAALLERFRPDEVAAALERVEPDAAARTVAQMAPLAAAACVAASSPARAAALLGAMPIDLATTILRRAPDAIVAQLLDDLPPSRAVAIRRLLTFPEGTVGALADPLAPALPGSMSVGDVVTWMRAHPGHASDVVFVVGRDQRLEGIVPVHLLVVSASSQSLDDVMHPATVVFPASMGAETARSSPIWGTQLVAPVVDHDGLFVGALPLSAVRRFLESRAEDPGGVAVGTLVRLGELYWSAWGRLLTELATAVTQPRKPAGGER